MKFLHTFVVCFFVTTSALSGYDTSESLLKQAQSDLSAGRYQSAVQRATDAAARFEKAADLSSQARALTTAGLAQLYSGDYTSARVRFEQALRLARRTGDVESEITRLNNIGTAHY